MPTHDDTPADRTVTLGIDGRRHILRTTQDRRHSLEVRAWALASGHRLPERGRIPLAVLRDYAAAHPQETPRRLALTGGAWSPSSPTDHRYRSLAGQPGRAGSASGRRTHRPRTGTPAEADRYVAAYGELLAACAEPSIPEPG